MLTCNRFQNKIMSGLEDVFHTILHSDILLQLIYFFPQCFA